MQDSVDDMDHNKPDYLMSESIYKDTHDLEKEEGDVEELKILIDCQEDLMQRMIDRRKLTPLYPRDAGRDRLELVKQRLRLFKGLLAHKQQHVEKLKRQLLWEANNCLLAATGSSVTRDDRRVRAHRTKLAKLRRTLDEFSRKPLSETGVSQETKEEAGGLANWLGVKIPILPDDPQYLIEIEGSSPNDVIRVLMETLRTAEDQTMVNKRQLRDAMSDLIEHIFEETERPRERKRAREPMSAVSMYE